MDARLIVMLGAVVVAGASPPPPAAALTSIPDETGVVILPGSESTLQAVAADLDGDGVRELVRLVPGADGTLQAEAWEERGGAWVRAGRPAVTIVGEGGQAERAYIGRPVRLLVRSIGGRDRVTLVRQPDFSEPEDEVGCCLLIDDLLLADEALRLVPVAEPGPIADAVHAIDLDGDGTDELLATRSLPPLGDVSYPTDARVYRWAGDGFAEPVVTRLPIGSGDTPFILGDSDGAPGEEAAIISVTGRPDLHRLSLHDGDVVRSEAAGLVATDALAVPLEGGRGIAVVGPVGGVSVMPWPRGEPPGPAIGRPELRDASILGVVEGGDAPHVVVSTESADLRLLRLPDLALRIEPAGTAGVAGRLGAGPLRPYAGGLPGGGRDGAAAVIHAGRLFGSDTVVEMASLAGARPIGLVGVGRGWLALHHAPTSAAPLDPRGGRLDRPAFAPISMVVLVPLEVASRAEVDGGRYAPELVGTAPLPSGALAVPADGFVARVEAPPGSLVYRANADSREPGPGRAIDASGRRDIRVTPNPAASGERPVETTMIVVTPAGHAYVTAWSLLVVDGPPELEASSLTPLGSAEVTVRGRTAPFATVTVDGVRAAVDADGRFASSVALPPWPTSVRVAAIDPFGQEASIVVTGVGVFDYRQLPWVPMTLLVVGVAAVILFLRVPRAHARARPVGDDAALEELDPDGPG